MKKPVRLNVEIEDWKTFVPEVIPDPVWAIEGMFERDSLVTLYGPSGEGKSFTAMAMAFHVAMGTPFLGNPDLRTFKGGAVVYLAAESPKGIKKRAKALALHHGLTPDKLPRMYFIQIPVQIWKAEDIIELIAKIKKLCPDPAFIIIDTLARTATGMKESDNGEMGIYVDGLDKIRRETGAAVMVIHHTPRHKAKGETSFAERGATALRAAMDTSIYVTKGSGGIITLKCMKQKDDVPFKPIHASLLSVLLNPEHDNEDGEHIKALDSAVLVPIEDTLPDDLDPRKQRVLDALTASPEPLTYSEWREKAKDPEGKLIPKGSFSRWLKEWKETKLIEEIDDKYQFKTT